MSNSPNLSNAIDYLRMVITARLRFYLHKEEIEVGEFTYTHDDSPFAKFIELHQPSIDECILLLLSITPHVYPDFFTQIIAENLPEGGDFPVFGGVKATNHRGVLPTGETAQFILAGDDLEKRIEIQNLLSSDHWFFKKHILWLEAVKEGEPIMSGRLTLDPEVVEQLTTGILSKPRFSADFPAEHVETQMNWDDLVLNAHTLRQIHEIEHWISHHETLREAWGMKKKIKPGYRALFYGPPGTGKTLTATLLGKHTGKAVFRIDLSLVVSKYIGETEKNLAKLFDKAEYKNWILFFDEADALFGKRTGIRDAHDKYANQEVSYLLQRVESYNGLVILATNQRSNIDDAFIRRFQTIIHFPMPRPEERHELWKKSFPSEITITTDINWLEIANRYELTGAGILNVAHYCSISALAEQINTAQSIGEQTIKVDLKRLEGAIRREYIKEGKII